MTHWIADASPLIFLAKLDRLDLLRRSATEVLLPPAVLEEVRRLPDKASTRVEEAFGSWLRMETAQDRSAVEVLELDLGPGEAEAIVLARETRAERIVLDDQDARRFARRLGLVPVGTLGILLAARLRGEIQEIRGEIDRLRAEGFRASPALLEAVLREAGEG
jgi:predicted nucleic acid-binding protein